MKKKKEKDVENSLHYEFGLWSNEKFILHNIYQYNKHIFAFMAIGFVCEPIMKYLWSFISKFVIDLITQEGNWKQLLWMMGTFVVMQILSTMLNTYYSNDIFWRYIYVRFCMMRENNMKVMTMTYQSLEDAQVMDCYQKSRNATNNNNQGVEGMMHQIEYGIKSLSVVIVGLCILSSMNMYLVLMMIGLGVINFLIYNHSSIEAKKHVWDPLSTWWRKNYYMGNLTNDFGAAKDIRMFNLSHWLVRRFQKVNEERYEKQKKNEQIWYVASASSGILWAITQVGVYAFLIYSVVQGDVSIGNFSLYLASTGTFFDHISNLLRVLSDLLARSREVDDFRSFHKVHSEEAPDEGRDVPEFQDYEFTFHNVSFQYPKSESYALQYLSLTVKASERLAVVGLNGAGKSTMIKLLLRLYEPTEGEICLNGINIKEFNRQSYFRIFAPVFQEVELYAVPLGENVSMTTKEKTDKMKALQCLEAAGLSEKLGELEHGVDTEVLKVIVDEGIDLSGGEKQKLALARALYKNAPVVVLDEPTAALDALAECKLYHDFDELIGGKTAIYISHRLSSTQFCNNVAMFENGEMVEYGTHEELLAQNGAYAKMFHIQAQYYIEGYESEAILDGEVKQYA